MSTLSILARDPIPRCCAITGESDRFIGGACWLCVGGRVLDCDVIEFDVGVPALGGDM